MSKFIGRIIAVSAALIATGTAASAAPVSSLPAVNAAPSNVQAVRHGRWGGVGVYIEPGYGYYDDGYYSDYYRPRRYYYDSYYDRPYRKHSRRWVKERFQHPLGRR